MEINSRSSVANIKNVAVKHHGQYHDNQLVLVWIYLIGQRKNTFPLHSVSLQKRNKNKIKIKWEFNFPLSNIRQYFKTKQTLNRHKFVTNQKPTLNNKTVASVFTKHLASGEKQLTSEWLVCRERGRCKNSPNTVPNIFSVIKNPHSNIKTAKQSSDNSPCRSTEWW